MERISLQIEWLRIFTIFLTTVKLPKLIRNIVPQMSLFFVLVLLAFSPPTLPRANLVRLKYETFSLYHVEEYPSDEIGRGCASHLQTRAETAKPTNKRDEKNFFLLHLGISLNELSHAYNALSTILCYFRLDKCFVQVNWVSAFRNFCMISLVHF